MTIRVQVRWVRWDRWRRLDWWRHASVAADGRFTTFVLCPFGRGPAIRISTDPVYARGRDAA